MLKSEYNKIGIWNLVPKIQIHSESVLVHTLNIVA